MRVDFPFAETTGWEAEADAAFASDRGAMAPPRIMSRRVIIEMIVA